MCQYQDGIERLGIKPYKHGTEAAHGMAWLGEATTFPQPIGLACTWDTDLLKRVGNVIGNEARGFYKKNPAINGLTLWAPTVDMERDPRWGRTEEAYGEDPILTGKLATALIHGIQGDHPFYLKAVASLKHFIGNNNEVDRGSCSVSIDPRNMHEYYLKAFELPFKEGGAQSMMTAYNSINGVPANFNPDVNNIVKQIWGMDGFVVSDAGDVLGTVNDHHYVETYKEAVARTIKAGIDSITDDHDISKQAIRDALADGLLEESDLDIALHNTFRVRMRLGEFDPDERNPYAAIDESIIMQPAHAQLALETTRKAIVLLKNDGILPLKAEKVKKIAIIGPLADIVYRDWYSGTLPYAVTPREGIQAQLTQEGQTLIYASGSDHIKLKSASTGRYVQLSKENNNALSASSENLEDAEVIAITDWGWEGHTLIANSNGLYVTTDDQGLTASAQEIWGWFTKEVFHARKSDNGESVKFTTWNDRPVTVESDNAQLLAQDGASADGETFIIEKTRDGIQEAIDAARNAEVAVVVVGNHPLINGKETIDRPDLTLPASQEKLIQEVYAANPNTVVIVVGSYPFALNWAQQHVPAIIYTSHAGQELGNALADVLFGQYNPAGRTNMTWYQSVDQLGAFMDYDIIKSERTYQYFAGQPLYPFGHGISYSSFKYDDLKIYSSLDGAGKPSYTIQCKVSNTSEITGEEVVQLYSRAIKSRVKRPLRQLQAFHRLSIEPGESATVKFELSAAQLAFWDVTQERFVVENGEVAFLIGASSGDIRLSESIHIQGESIPPRDLRQLTKAVNFDDYCQIIIGDNIEGGDSVVATAPLSWVAYHDVELQADVTRFSARVLGDAGSVLSVHLDQPDGPLIGSCTMEDELNVWRTVTGQLQQATGRHSVYVVLQGNVRISTFQFS
ncbi:MAG: glycoside hydrolase family 3 C-terminal domain-containing protein [Candidatus Cohnella colombiensis]|uniref:Glycoside hydrolase family 3 C-terminal domain-containing protein n=1 Tax=Candidatus Cohnella colombiensis TaxID=3121368 RepID=A0AA95JBS7_9BACL|nr:MAG: glycoside hydrolase family 3 C-terminal domain-containing protein [Cohnella sp.]